MFGIVLLGCPRGAGCPLGSVITYLPQSQAGCSHPQLGSQQQLASQQPQPRWQWNMFRMPSNRQHRGRQHGSQPQLDSQQHEGSQAQVFSHPQLGSQAQVCSQQHEGSQQLEQQFLRHFSRLPRPSRRQQRRWEQGAQQLGSQQQEGSQAQLCSQPHVGSQQP